MLWRDGWALAWWCSSATYLYSGPVDVHVVWYGGMLAKQNTVLSVLGSTFLVGNGAGLFSAGLWEGQCAGKIVSWSACCESEPDESDFSAFALRRCSRHQCLRVLLPRRHPRWRICLTPRRSLRVLSLLAGLGVSDVLLQQVKSSIPPPAADKQKSAGPEKQLQIIAGKIFCDGTAGLANFRRRRNV